jgi:hypothetical protein
MALIDIANRDRGTMINRTHGTRSVVKYLQDNAVINEVLDVFAGDGSFCSYLLYRLNSALSLPSITHLEQDAVKWKKLNNQFGRNRNNCLNVDSYDWMSNKSEPNKYDLIFCDNGMNSNEYFDIIPLLGANLNNTSDGINSWFVHNINVRPYGNFSSNVAWQQQRSHFYEMDDTSDCDPEDLLEATAKRIKEHYGDVVNYGTLFPRELYNGHTYLYHAVWSLK